MRVSVQVFSYDEGYDDLWGTMDAYAGCAEPSWADVDYWACVTPKPGQTASHPARHPRAAREHPVFEFFETPKGKLRSRNEAHQSAAESAYDVIVTGDADGPPLTDEYLARLLEPLRDPEVVATNSYPISTGGLGPVLDLVSGIEDLAMPHMHGQGSAFTSEAWQEAGPFVTPDETSMHHVRAAEEFGFYRDLKRLGDVRFAPGALVANDTRRAMCKFHRVRPRRFQDKPYCSRLGTETFHPAGNRR